MEENGKVLTRAEALKNPCRSCYVPVGMSCHSQPTGPICKTRMQQAQRDKEAKLLGDNITLTPGEKALAVYYAFIMLCDSTSAKSQQMIGKQISSLEIQGRYIHEAIKELKKDGLLV